uniref:Leucine rich immune protein (Coil-less) n=1 Tax=Anopheles maculatus TaxID=74869 RepID=A0A182T0E6_9DIPT
MGWLIHCYVSLLLSTVTAQNVWPGSSSRYTPTRRPNAQDTHGYRQSYNCKESNLHYDCIFYDVSIDRYPQHPVNFGYGDVRQNNHKNVTFTNSTLRRLPASLLASFQEVEILDLGNLQIETIEERALSHGAYLRELYMGFNNIYNLPASAFISMPLLSKLVLDRNNLRSLPKRIFHHTPNLYALSIANNMLERIDDDTFKQNGALQHLSLSGNTLTHIDLSLIPSLYYGNVSTNQLTTLAIPSAVEVLDASHNRINQVTGPFNNLLTILHLKHNNLTDTAWLQNYPGLVHVDLSYNELEHLTNQNFSNMKQLEK